MFLLKTIIIYQLRTSLKLLLLSALIVQFFAQDGINLKINIPNEISFTPGSIQFKNDKGSSIFSITDENGSAASLLIPALGSGLTNYDNKLYNIASVLYWNGSPLGTSNNAAGWISLNTKIHLENNTDDVGIGTTSPTDKLHIVAEPDQDALRVQINSATKLRVLSNGGTSIGSNNTSPPENGLYVHGRILSDNIISSSDMLYTTGEMKVGVSGTKFQSMVKIFDNTNSITNVTTIPYPSGYDWLNTQVVALKIRDEQGFYKAISQDYNDSFSITLKVPNIEVIVPNSNFRNKNYQLVLMRMD